MIQPMRRWLLPIILPVILAAEGWHFEPFVGIGPAQGEFRWVSAGEHESEGAFTSTLEWQGLQSRRERIGLYATRNFWELTLTYDRGTLRDGSVEDTDRYAQEGSILNSQTRHSTSGRHRTLTGHLGVRLGEPDFQVIPQLLWLQRTDRYRIGSGYHTADNRATGEVNSRYEARFEGFGGALELRSALSETLTLRAGLQAVVATYEADALWDQREAADQRFEHSSEGTLQSGWLQVDLKTGLPLTLWGRFEKNRFKGRGGEDVTPRRGHTQPFKGASLDEHLWLFGLQANFQESP